MKKHLEGLLQQAIIEASKGGALKSTSLPPLIVEVPKDAAFGDLATPIAMGLARAERQSPRAIAETLVAHLKDPDGLVESTEIAGPGYLNFRFSSRFWQRCLADLEAEDCGVPAVGRGERVLVEFVSGNPTGPLHVGHGRGAVTGDVVARLLEAGGFSVVREYYVNDAGRQLEVLGRSVLARLRQVLGEDAAVPEDGYPGEYLLDLARERADDLLGAVALALGAPLPADAAGRLALLAQDPETAAAASAREAARLIMDLIRADLALCDIHFDSFVSEQALRDAGAIEAALSDLERGDLVYEKDGARWFRSTRFGDDKDRVVERSNGELTYFASDIAYHRDKLRRGFVRLINIWGADHHGYIARVRAGIEALGSAPGALQILLVQIVHLTRSGTPVRMGKRSGEFVALREILEEVGPDAARFFFLLRKADSQLEFDLDLAKKQGSDNPVFYVQYAHARCCSLFRQAEAAGLALPPIAEVEVERLSSAEEIELIKQLALFPDAVGDATADLEPHRLVFHLIDLAATFHRFYNQHRILGEEPPVSRARLYLTSATRHVIRRGLYLLGVRAPETM
jgi:arginyl-tRNA synthetase